MLTSKTERRSQAERRDEAEQRLLAAAVRLVGERGLERITLSEVGEAAGYSRGLPAHYFGGKSGMVVSLVQHIIDSFGRALVRAEHHDLGLDRLLGTVAFYFTQARRDPVGARALAVLLGEGLTNELVADRLAELNARSAGAFEAMLTAAAAAGEIRHDIDVRAEAILILASLRGAVGQWLLASDAIDLDAVSAAFVTALKRSLAP
ncbi:MAG TPA: TetR/AcrR family transcriptional regulator [Caulobacteraceae bacterium]